MRIIISPAKKMNADADGLAPEGLPLFLPEARRLLAALQALSDGELQTLWRCSDALAAENIGQLRRMDLLRGLTPAILAYDGIQYRYMAPGVFEERHYAYLREHLRILSGFYGLLRPFDGVTPYRLEMQAALTADGCRNLYAFWGGKLAEQLASETGLVVNLASGEYSEAVRPWLPERVRFLTCVFGQRQGGRIAEKGTLCKMARGRMVRWMAENGVERPEALCSFAELGYRYSPEDSLPDRLVFLKGDL